jgi:putative spermidine/putrescine transport system ATP-binding protein
LPFAVSSASDAEPIEPAPEPPPAAPPAVRLQGLHKSYGDVVALADLDLEVHRGEFFTLLGPSGSGKTTTLRLIAGFEHPDRGTVQLDGIDVTRQAPYQRDVNTVFQDYALFPHMTVADNVAYGLQVQGIGKAQRRERADEALAMVRLEGLGKRKPIQLSGGQRQRVALARALVNRPAVLLLDEPLGALDLKLRQEMQLELKRIQGEIGDAITFVYVTHDQEEALTMSDRVGVFSSGRLEQIGTPGEIYEHPVNEFVAGFVGTSNVVERDGTRYTIRPEKITVLSDDDPAPDDCIVETGTVTEVIYLGATTRYVVDLQDGSTLSVLRQNTTTSAEHALSERGRRWRLAWRTDQMSALTPPDTQEKDSPS